jgi:CRISPR-associated protein Cas1
MLSLPDFKEKQVLFIRAEHGVSNNIRFLNDNIVFSKGGKIINRASCHRVFAVFVIGDMTITSGLMKDGARYGVSFFFLKENLETYATINATVEGHVILRARQYSSTRERDFEMAKKLVQNKIENQCVLLKERKMNEGLLKNEVRFLEAVHKSENATTLRGIEGSASRAFFQEFNKDLKWHRRAPRTKEDIPNTLLDIGYNMLFHCMDSLLRLHGFDTYKGFYHLLFFQRRSLACDVMEPMRCAIDRALLKMHNLKQIDPKDFIISDGRYILPWNKSKKYSEAFLTAIMDQKEGMYRYIHEYYRYVLSEGETEFPVFTLNV